MTYWKEIGISMDKFMIETYNCMLVSIFETIANELDDQEYRKKVKNRLLMSSNKLLTTKRIVYELTRCELNNDECLVMYKYIYAYFTKANRRIKYDDIIKQKLLMKQEYCCNICSTEINILNSELDHIVPWSYVGDELGIDNLQMLCKDCNRRKSKNSAYNLKMFLINK